ncbi:MAG TPA: SCO family protein [Opitutus sp.]|nr:SCO family protein [Opitutus sp.]
MNDDRSHALPAPTAADRGWRGFFTGTGLPLFMLAAATVYELFLLAVVFAPESTSAWGDFSREFKQWCFRYDARTGGMEWAAVWVMLIEPAFVVLVAAFVWRRGLRPLRQLAGWLRHWRAAAGGIVVAALAMGGLYAYGRPGAEAEAVLPFPGERIRTQLAPPANVFVDQKGQPLALADLRGRVVLMTGVYAFCSTACPEILQETKALLATLPVGVRDRLAVVAVSLNPEYDTAELMDNVATGYGFAYPEFRYLNGEPTAMHAALTQLGFGAVRNPATGVVDHANLFLVLDAEGRIAYRFTLDPRHRSWLREAILALAEEAA